MDKLPMQKVMNLLMKGETLRDGHLFYRLTDKLECSIDTYKWVNSSRPINSLSKSVKAEKCITCYNYRCTCTTIKRN